MSRASIRRFLDQPAFVLHRYDWSETSLIIEVFSRQHGRLALVAKGAKRPTSQLRPVLLPLQPLLLSWSGEGEVRTLKTAQWRGGHVMPMGEALLAGTYFNEMLMRLLVRDEPHPALFDTYAQAVERLAQRGEPDPCVLRAFELLLLKESGYLPMLSEEGNTLARWSRERPTFWSQRGACAAHSRPTNGPWLPRTGRPCKPHWPIRMRWMPSSPPAARA